nr:E3 ubiquitin-protein ligase UPL2-like [Ipomoea trifida]
MMEHDQHIDGDFGLQNDDDDYMHENNEGSRALENGNDVVGIRFELQPDVQDNLGEDEDADDGISVDEGDTNDDDMIFLDREHDLSLRPYGRRD